MPIIVTGMEGYVNLKNVVPEETAGKG